MSHTPGPWQAVNHSDLVSEDMLETYGERARALYVGPNRLQTVCSINGPCMLVPPDQVDANAALISAAPDLLECCKAALVAQRTDSVDWDEIARTVAKAEGRK